MAHARIGGHGLGHHVAVDEHDHLHAVPPQLDPPAGGLDVVPPRPLLDPEAFPGESQLTDDERNRRLILHFALPRTIMTRDMTEGRTTEVELNDALSAMAWGTIDRQTSDWVLESEDPTPVPPEPSLISYAEYVARMYSVGEAESAEDNVRLAAQKRACFTEQGEPGSKFRPMFDQMVKNLTFQSKALMKTYELKKVVLNEDEVEEDPAKTDAQNILRYCRHQVLPAFYQLLISLTRRGRRFSIIFRSFSTEQLADAQRELHYFCAGQHPAYSGKDKTIKPPLMNGEKGSFDRRLAAPSIGHIDRTLGQLTFPDRPSNPVAESPEGVIATGATEAPADGGVAANEDVGEVSTQPTRYMFPPYHEAYAGIMEHILDGEKTAAIIDDFKYWEESGRQAEAGKLLLVDHAGGFAETKVQHILFDGNAQWRNAHCVDVRDVVSGSPIALDHSEGVFLHRVDFFQAITDPEYFVKAVDSCELEMSRRIVESRKVPRQETRATAASTAELPPKEYLYRNVIPALLPALEACQRDRPEDPIEFIAFYMLRHGKEYSKTLKG